jgi:hypothetical protein
MTQVLDSLVSYFGLDENEQPSYQRYYCYHIVAGPGASAGSGIAAITTVAIYDESERCNYCQRFHVVQAGGPEAALNEAFRYLNAYHQRDHVRRVQSQVRGHGSGPVQDRPNDIAEGTVLAHFG